MASRFGEVRGLLLASTGAGLSLPDAARQAGVPLPTVRMWLTKGRKGDPRYAPFAAEIDAAREVAQSRPAPMTRDELLEVVSATARKGSVQAQRLYWEMLTYADSDRADEKPPQNFEEFDELARRRAA